MVANNTRFSYEFMSIGDLAVTSTPDPKSGRPIVDSIIVHDEPIKPSDRFWNSMFARYGFNKSMFKYFSHAEAFARISEVEVADQMRLCIEHTTTKNGKEVSTMLAVSNPNKPVVEHDQLIESLETYKGERITYNDGIVESTHTPRVGAASFDIAGDTFNNQFVMATPIDGYGSPNIYLSLLRQICENGMIGLSKAFRSSLNLGKASDDVMPTIARALDGFNSDEGYAAIRQRMENATLSYLSLAEQTSLYKLLIKLHSGSNLRSVDPKLARGPSLKGYIFDKVHGGDGASEGYSPTDLPEENESSAPILSAFHQMTGDACRLYGLANVDAIAIKRQRTLPMACTVYDAINFATELSSHYTAPSASRKLNAWVGTVIGEEYDMELTKETYPDFKDFHIQEKLGQQLTGSK